MPTIKPVAHEARLSIVEHLDELRTRLVWMVITYMLAFGICYSQNHRILDWLNKPLAAAKTVDCSKQKSAGALENAGCFNEQLAKALKVSAPAISQAGSALTSLSESQGVAADARVKAVTAAKALNEAAAKLEAAALIAPKAATANRVQPVTLGVTEPFLTTITVSGYAALLLSLPMVLYQLFAFILPAFTGRERQLALPAMVASPVLFIAGVAFSYFLALPRAISFLQNYNDGQYDILVQAQAYYRFVIILLAGLGLLFQIPLAVLAIVRLQILTPKQLRATRGYALLLFAVIAAVVTPTPDPVTMLISMAPLVVLYEASIQLSRFVVPSGSSRWSFGFGNDDDDEDDSDGPADDETETSDSPARLEPTSDDDGLD